MDKIARILFSAAAVIAITITYGCANTPPPKTAMAVSEVAVANAQAAGAHEFAPVQIQSAQEKLSQARVEMERENYVTARELAEQAEVDANFAYYAARNAVAQRSAAELQESIEILRRELQPES
ncbi:MAG: DUF4398 domain-containing protein [Desulfuromonadales bacterium]